MLSFDCGSRVYFCSRAIPHLLPLATLRNLFASFRIPPVCALRQASDAATFSPILWPSSLFGPHLSAFSPKTCQFHASSSISDAFSSRMRSFSLFTTHLVTLLPQNVPILPLFVICLVAAVTSSEKLCLSWAKLFHIPVPAAKFGHIFRKNASFCVFRHSFGHVFPQNAPVCCILCRFATFWGVKCSKTLLSPAVCYV